MDLFAASAGVLTPILLFWISRTAGDAQGAQLGSQTAVASLGQTLGSVATGLFLASSLWSGLVFMIMAVMLMLTCLVAILLVRGLEKLPAPVRGGAAVHPPAFSNEP